MNSIPVQAIYLSVGLNDPCGSLAAQNILWFLFSEKKSKLSLKFQHSAVSVCKLGTSDLKPMLWQSWTLQYHGPYRDNHAKENL